MRSGTRVILGTLLLMAPACGQVAAAHRNVVQPTLNPSPVATVTQPVQSPVAPPKKHPAPRHSSTPKPTHVDAGPDLSAYQGLGTWIDQYSENDVYGPQAFGVAATTVRAMAADGVRTLFLETGSYKHPAVAFPEATAALIRAAHAVGIKVIGWYLPMFRNVRFDLGEVMRTIDFRTSDGQRFDGFALDIEADLVPPVQRIANFLTLSQRIRAAVGPDYALGAIIPSPEGLVRVPSYWPGFPYDQLGRYYDVVLPMSYFTFHYHGAAVANRYIRGNVEIIRQRSGDPNIPIHVIGGIAGDMTVAETQAFVDAVRTEHILGASLYEFPDTRADQWPILAPLRG